MSLFFRTLFGLVSAAGLGACALAFFNTFSAARAGAIFEWFIPLLLGMFALLIGLFALEYPASFAPGFGRSLHRTLPRSCRYFIVAIAIAGATQLSWFIARNGWGAPVILDGQYVLEARGHIMRLLTREEYRALIQETARFVATIMLGMYFSLTAHFWFTRTGVSAKQQ